MSKIHNNDNQPNYPDTAATGAVAELQQRVDSVSLRNVANASSTSKKPLKRTIKAPKPKAKPKSKPKSKPSSSSVVDVDMGGDASGDDDFTVHIDTSTPVNFMVPTTSSSVVTSTGVSQLVDNIKLLLDQPGAPDKYLFKNVKSRRERCRTIDKSVIKSEIEIEDVKSTISMNRALEHSDLLATRIDIYAAKAEAADKAVVRKKRKRFIMADDEERAGIKRTKKAMHLPGMDKVVAVAHEALDANDVRSEFENLERRANANLAAEARDVRSRERVTLVLKLRKLNEARPGLLAKQRDLHSNLEADILFTGWCRSLRDASKAGRLGDSITEADVAELLEGYVAPARSPAKDEEDDEDDDE